MWAEQIVYSWLVEAHNNNTPLEELSNRLPRIKNTGEKDVKV